VQEVFIVEATYLMKICQGMIKAHHRLIIYFTFYDAIGYTFCKFIRVDIRTLWFILSNYVADSPRYVWPN